MTKAERVRIIAKTLRNAGEPVTQGAIAKQYKYETGEDLNPEKGTSVGAVIRLPAQDAEVEGVRCRICGCVIVRTRDELQSNKDDRDVCFCCSRGIRLPMFNPQPCPDCDGTGFTAVHVCRDEGECQRACPKPEHCMACLGRGSR